MKMVAKAAAAAISFLLFAPVLRDASGSNESLLQRGAYLVNVTAACGRCHTPRDAQSKPVAGMELAGGLEFDDGVLGHIVVPNITADRETGIGSWTQAQIVTALRDGKRPDGTIIGPPMPFSAYRELSDRDANAIAAYLQTVKPIRHRVARSEYKISLPTSHGPPVKHVPEPSRRPIWLALSRIASAVIRPCGRAESNSTASTLTPAAASCRNTATPAPSLSVATSHPIQRPA
jgi:mono/diheme cytochrome c family protein